MRWTLRAKKKWPCLVLQRSLCPTTHIASANTGAREPVRLDVGLQLAGLFQSSLMKAGAGAARSGLTKFCSALFGGTRSR